MRDHMVQSSPPFSNVEKTRDTSMCQSEQAVISYFTHISKPWSTTATFNMQPWRFVQPSQHFYHFLPTRSIDPSIINFYTTFWRLSTIISIPTWLFTMTLQPTHAARMKMPTFILYMSISVTMGTWNTFLTRTWFIKTCSTTNVRSIASNARSLSFTKSKAFKFSPPNGFDGLLS